MLLYSLLYNKLYAGINVTLLWTQRNTFQNYVVTEFVNNARTDLYVIIYIANLVSICTVLCNIGFSEFICVTYNA